jgi:hypothetical protein
MRFLKSSLLCLSVLVPATSCKEVFEPDLLAAGNRIPVIKGLIQEGTGPTVTLSYAMAYKDQISETVSGATVVISDNAGNSAELAETENGTYAADAADFAGVLGRTYTLRVTWPDGSTYESAPQYLDRPPVIDSLYAEPATRTVEAFNYYKQVIPEVQEGLRIRADISDAGSGVRKYRFSTKVIKETVAVIGKGNTGSVSVYRWELSYLDNATAVDYSLATAAGTVLRKHDTGFLRYFIDRNLETPTTSAPYILGWILVFKVSPVSDDVYAYYESVAKQLRSNDEVFSPDPAQVKSNIRCTSRPGDPVIGIFEASSLTTVCKVFAWKNLDEYKSMDLPDFADTLNSGYQPVNPPQFFVIL